MSDAHYGAALKEGTGAVILLWGLWSPATVKVREPELMKVKESTKNG